MSSAAGASFLFLFRASNSLRPGSGLPWMSSYLGTKVPRGFDTELSPKKMEPIGRKTLFLLNGPLPAQTVRGLQLCVSFCHSIFLSHTSDKWMGSIDVCATMAFLKAHDRILLFSPHRTKLKKLWGLLSTTAECGLQCTRPFHQTLSLPLGIPESFFLKFLLL